MHTLRLKSHHYTVFDLAFKIMLCTCTYSCEKESGDRTELSNTSQGNQSITCVLIPIRAKLQIVAQYIFNLNKIHYAKTVAEAHNSLKLHLSIGWANNSCSLTLLDMHVS